MHKRYKINAMVNLGRQSMELNRQKQMKKFKLTDYRYARARKIIDRERERLERWIGR